MALSLACLLAVADGATLGKATDCTKGLHITEGRPQPNARYFFSIGDFGAVRCEQAYNEYKSSNDPSLKKWGNHDCRAERQRSVARAMEALAKGLSPQFVISLGDNFYDGGVRDLEDPQLQDSYEDVYGFGALTDVPWHISLGDHDHRGNVSALVHYSKISHRWRLPWSFYRFLPDLGSFDPLSVFITDSVGLEARFLEVKGQTRRFDEDYSEPAFNGAKAAEKQWKWLNRTLHKEVAEGVLRIVVGHRPVLSVVDRGRTANEAATADSLRSTLHDAARAQGAPILYLSGHDHAMQHLQDDHVTYLSAGVGGLNLHPIADGLKELVWAKNESYGFLVHEVVRENMKVYFVASDRSVQHIVNVPLRRAKRTRRRTEL